MSTCGTVEGKITWVGVLDRSSSRKPEPLVENEGEQGRDGDGVAGEKSGTDYSAAI